MFYSTKFVFFMKEPEREKKESERDESEPVQTLIDGHSRYRSCALSLSLIFSQTVSSYRNKCSNSQHLLHTICIPSPFGHCRLQ